MRLDSAPLRAEGDLPRAALLIFKRERIGCHNWGHVNGKTETHVAWSGESYRWFHDVLQADGTSYPTRTRWYCSAISPVRALDI